MKQHEAGWRCPECNLHRNSDLVDPCLGKLPGVRFACCGHGSKGDSMGYIYFENGVTIRFERLYTVEKQTASGDWHKVVENLDGIDFSPLYRSVINDER